MAKNFKKEEEKNKKFSIPLGKYTEVDIRSIKDNKNQTRSNENDKEYQKGIDILKKDIEKNGLINPITLARDINADKEEYELIAGSRRLNAYKKSDKAKSLIPAIIFVLDSKNNDYEFIKYLITVSENIKRENNIPIDEIRAVANLKFKFNKMEVPEIAQYLGVSQARVYDYFKVIEEEKIIEKNISKYELSLTDIKSKVHLINLAKLIRNKEIDNIPNYIETTILKTNINSSDKQDKSLKTNEKEKNPKSKKEIPKNILTSTGQYKFDFSNNNKIIISNSKSQNKEYMNVIKTVLEKTSLYDDNGDFTNFLINNHEQIGDHVNQIFEYLKKEFNEKTA